MPELIEQEVIPTCAFCFHYRAKGEMGECHRNPPTPFLIMNKNPLTGEVSPSAISAFTPVAHTEMCGEFFPASDGDIYFTDIETVEEPQVVN